jgi:hypothetical protein
MVRKVMYDFRVPAGAGEGYKVERKPAPPLGGICFQNMQSVADLDSTCATAPGEHTMITERIKAMGKVREARRQGVRMSDREVDVPRPRRMTFSNGATVRDVKSRRRGIIIKASAGYTKKTHSPVHKLCDENGDTWLAKEKDLKLIH